MKINVRNGIVLSVVLTCCGEVVSEPLTEYCPFPRSAVASLCGFEKQEGNPFVTFGVDVLAWGADPAYVSDDWLSGLIRQARDGGAVLYSANADVITATAKVMHQHPELQEAVLRDLDGQPVVVPWFSQVSYEGTPTWIACTNHPAYRSHLTEKLRHGVRLGANALHLDTPEGSHRLMWGGCFCDFCENRFQDFLLDLRETKGYRIDGADWGEPWDYRELLRKDYTAAGFLRAMKEQPGAIPLNQEYTRFQREAFSGFVKQMQATLEEEFDRRLPLSTNVYNLRPESLEMIAVSDFLTAEIEHHAGAKTQPQASTLFSLKLCTALGRRLVTTASGWDWSDVRDRHDMAALQFWIAQAYATGHHFMVPSQQWLITNDEQEARFYTPPREVVLPYYRFIQDHAYLFDDAHEAAEVAFVMDLDAYSAEADRETSLAYRQFAALVQAGHIPQIVVTSHDRFVSFLENRTLPDVDAVVISGGVQPDPELAAWIHASQQRGAAIYRLTDENTSPLTCPSPQRIDRGSAVIFPRRLIDAGGTSCHVYHVLSTNRIPGKDMVELQQDVIVSIRIKDTRRDQLKTVRWHTPGEPSVQLPVEVVGEELRIGLPRLDIWGVIEFSRP